MAASHTIAALRFSAFASFDASVILTALISFSASCAIAAEWRGEDDLGLADPGPLHPGGGVPVPATARPPSEAGGGGGGGGGGKGGIATWPPLQPLSTLTNIAYLTSALPLLCKTKRTHARFPVTAGAAAVVVAQMGWTSFVYHSNGGYSNTPEHFADISAIKSGGLFFAGMAAAVLVFDAVRSLCPRFCASRHKRGDDVGDVESADGEESDAGEPPSCNHADAAAALFGIGLGFGGYILAPRLPLVLSASATFGVASGCALVRQLLFFVIARTRSTHSWPWRASHRPVSIKRACQTGFLAAVEVVGFLVVLTAVPLASIGIGWRLNVLGEKYREIHPDPREDVCHALWHSSSAVFLYTVLGRLLLVPTEPAEPDRPPPSAGSISSSTAALARCTLFVITLISLWRFLASEGVSSNSAFVAASSVVAVVSGVSLLVLLVLLVPLPFPRLPRRCLRSTSP